MMTPRQCAETIVKMLLLPSEYNQETIGEVEDLVIMTAIDSAEVVRKEISAELRVMLEKYDPPMEEAPAGPLALPPPHTHAFDVIGDNVTRLKP